MTKNNLLIFITGILLSITSCNEKRIFEQYEEIDDAVWHADSIITFSANIKDTVNPYDLFVHIRNSGKYSYSNLYLFITIKFPKTGSIHDTLECILADKKGKWLGKGFGGVWNNPIPYKKAIRFPRKGIYTFTIEQAMRKEKLPAILDVGLRIEQSKI